MFCSDMLMIFASSIYKYGMEALCKYADYGSWEAWEQALWPTLNLTLNFEGATWACGLAGLRGCGVTS
jgi:hypothetical protein